MNVIDIEIHRRAFKDFSPAPRSRIQRKSIEYTRHDVHMNFSRLLASSDPPPVFIYSPHLPPPPLSFPHSLSVIAFFQLTISFLSIMPTKVLVFLK